MATVNTGEGYALDLVPIERIELGDLVVTRKSDGDPRLWQVDAKGFKYSRASGERPVIELRAKAELGAKFVASCQAPVGTLMHRVIPVQPQERRVDTAPMSTETDKATVPNADYRHPKCYANTRGGCSTKISGEHFISHSLIKLYSFDDPGLQIKHDTGYGVQNFVSPNKFVANILCEKHNNDLHTADGP